MNPAQPLPGAAPSVAAPVLNAANALTVLRLLLVPVFAALLFAGDGDQLAWRLAALAVFVLASVTDLIDGDIARKRGLVTAFGTIADPIADKALTGTALVGLALLGELAWLVTVVVLVREVGVTLLRFWVIRHGVLAASRGGKIKTVVQGVAIGLYIVPLSGALAVGAALVMGLAVVVTVVTGADYVLRALTLRRTSARAAASRERSSGQAASRRNS